MKFSMTIGANQNTFIEFLFYTLPSSRISFGRNAKVFFLVFEVMELERLSTS